MYAHIYICIHISTYRDEDENENASERTPQMNMKIRQYAYRIYYCFWLLLFIVFFIARMT